MDDKFAAIGKSLAWKGYRAFCKAVLNHPDVAKEMLREIGNLVRNECVSLVISNHPSTLRKKSKSELTAFNWTDIASEWEISNGTKRRRLSLPSAFHHCVWQVLCF